MTYDDIAEVIHNMSDESRQQSAKLMVLGMPDQEDIILGIYTLSKIEVDDTPIEKGRYVFT